MVTLTFQIGDTGRKKDIGAQKRQLKFTFKNLLKISVSRD